MDLKSQNFIKDGSDSKISVSDEVFAKQFNEALVHQTVVSYLSGSRQGSKAQKNRSEVRGGGAKPWRQKGTGRARAGTKSSPIWRSGGVTFAAKPRAYDKKINRKMYKGALQSILSELVRNNKLMVVKSLDIDSPKTKQLALNLIKFGLTNVLIISGEVSENLYLAARNIPNVGVIEAQVVDPVALVSYQNVLLSESAVKVLEERFK